MVIWSVLIVGSGPAGAYLAKLLADNGIDVLLLDRPKRKDPFLETLSSQARPLFDAPITIGACTSNRSRWGSDEIVERAGIVRPWGHDWFLDRPSFDSQLCADAVAAGAVCLQLGAVSVKREEGAWVVGLSDGRRVKSRFLVDASGRRSVIATRLGSSRVRLDALVGIPMSLATGDAAFGNSTLVASTSDGWWYAGPDASGGVCAVYFTDADLPAFKTLRGNGHLRQLLIQSELFKCADAIPCGRPCIAFSEILRPCAGDGWLAVGDAAASFDPLASQGIYHALLTATYAVDVMANNKSTAEFQSRLWVEFLEYTAGRASVYGREKRWAESPFWHRRASAGQFSNPTPMSQTRSHPWQFPM